MTSARRPDPEQHIDDLSRFVAASPSSYHAAAETARRLDEAGYTRLDEREPWGDTSGDHYVIRDGAIIAWRQPAGADAGIPFRILGAHTDSPGFKLKPQ
ncbi:MAG: M18 family aminopeptidase, partial [Mycetocola reblochoni]